MQITDQKAMHIANYLGKGAFIDKNRDISIQIGDKSEIGINKRGNKYALYVKYDNRLDKSVQLPLYSGATSIDSLAQGVKIIIEQSLSLENIELDMKKVPLINDDEAEFDLTDYSTYSTEDEFEEYGAMEASGQQTAGFPPSPLPPDSLEPLIEIYDQNSNDNLKEEYPMNNTENKNFAIALDSYLYQTLGDEAAIKDKLARAVSRLTDMDRESITGFYIQMLNSLLFLYQNDITMLSDDTGIDSRDIALATYEIKML